MEILLTEFNSTFGPNPDHVPQPGTNQPLSSSKVDLGAHEPRKEDAAQTPESAMADPTVDEMTVENPTIALDLLAKDAHPMQQ
jgi:hypothetical protein